MSTANRQYLKQESENVVTQLNRTMQTSMIQPGKHRSRFARALMLIKQYDAINYSLGRTGKVKLADKHAKTLKVWLDLRIRKYILWN